MKPDRLRKGALKPLSIPALFLAIPKAIWRIYWDQLSLDGVPFFPVWCAIFHAVNILYTPRPDGFRNMVKNTALNVIWTYPDFLWIPLGILVLSGKIWEVINARWQHFRLRKSGFEWAYLALFAAIVLAEVKLDSYPTRVGLFLWGWWWYRDPWEALARHTVFGWIFMWFSYARVHGWFFIIWELWPFWNRHGNIYWSHPDASRLPGLRWHWSWERLEVLTRMFNQCALFGTAALFVRMSFYRHDQRIPWPPSVMDTVDPRSLQNTIPVYWQYLRTYTRIISPWLFATSFILWQFCEGYESRERWGLEGFQLTLEPELGIRSLPLAIKIGPRPTSPESEQRSPYPPTPTPVKKMPTIETGTPIIDRTRQPIRDVRAVNRLANVRQFHDFIQKAHRRTSPPGTWLEFTDRAWAEGVEVEFTVFLAHYVVNYLEAEQVRIDRPLAQRIREFLSNIYEEAIGDDSEEEVTYILDEKPDEFRTLLEENGELNSKRCPKSMEKWFQKYKHYPGDEILNKARTGELVRHESLGDKPRIATKKVNVGKNRTPKYDLTGDPIMRGERYWKNLLDFEEIERVKKAEKGNVKDATDEKPGNNQGCGPRGGRHRTNTNTGLLVRSARKPTGRREDILSPHLRHNESEADSICRVVQEWLPDFSSREESVVSRDPANANGGYLDDDEETQPSSSLTLSIIIILSMLILWSKIFGNEPSEPGQVAQPEEPRWEPVVEPAERYSHKLEELLDLPTELGAAVGAESDTVKWVGDEKLREDLEYLENWGERNAERERVKFEG